MILSITFTLVFHLNDRSTHGLLAGCSFDSTLIRPGCLTPTPPARSLYTIYPINIPFPRLVYQLRGI